jgi:hypothetical protein
VSPSLLLDDLVAARTLERHEQASAYRRRHALPVAPPLRARIGWRMVEVGLRLATSAEPGHARAPACR